MRFTPRKGCLGAEPPTDDGAIAVDVDVLDFETDVRGRWMSALPPGEALVVAGPHVAVGRGADTLHDAVVGDDVDELLRRPQQERLVELFDHGRRYRSCPQCAVGRLREQYPVGNGSDAATRGTTESVTNRFPAHLQRSRKARRLSQLELARAGGNHAATLELHRAGTLASGARRSSRGSPTRWSCRCGSATTCSSPPASPLRSRSPRSTTRRFAQYFARSTRFSTATSRIRPWSCAPTACSSLPTAAFDVFHEDVDPALLEAPVNVFRLALHPNGIAPRVGNLPEWGRHVTENLRARLVRSPDPSLEVLLDRARGLPPTAADRARRPRVRGAAGARVRRRPSSAHHDTDLVRHRHRHHPRRTAPRSLPPGRRNDGRRAPQASGALVTVDTLDRWCCRPLDEIWSWSPSFRPLDTSTGWSWWSRLVEFGALDGGGGVR